MASPVVDLSEFVAVPRDGRRVNRSRAVRLGDVTGTGRVRLDALARYLQDVAADDVDEAGLPGAWVLRRLVLALGDPPRYRDELHLTTFCSGIGRRFAERRTTVRVGERVAVEAVALWVYVDDAGRPAPLQDWFFDYYGAAAAGRRVTSRLRHPGPPESCERRPWPLRVTDIDVLDHVNNAASWAAVEDELARRAPQEAVRRAEMEYRAAVDIGDAVDLCVAPEADPLSCWLVCGDQVRTSARVALA